MEQQHIQALTASFEGHVQQTENGVECWLARDLQHLLGYGKWDNIQILSTWDKAITTTEKLLANSEHLVLLSLLSSIVRHIA